MAEINDGINQGTDFREKVAFEFFFFMNKLKETVIDAIGIEWIFENGLSKVWSAMAVMMPTALILTTRSR